MLYEATTAAVLGLFVEALLSTCVALLPSLCLHAVEDGSTVDFRADLPFRPPHHSLLRPARHVLHARCPVPLLSGCNCAAVRANRAIRVKGLLSGTGVGSYSSTDALALHSDLA